MDIGFWLSELDLSRYAETFRDNEIGMDILSDLTEADLRDLAIPLGDRKRIMRGIAALEAVANAPRDQQISSEVRREAERRHLTVMFVDLVESTRIASELDPEEMRDLIRAYQNAVAGEVLRFGGYIAKFMGDGVLCYFGFPAASDNDPERAVRAGEAIINATTPIITARGEKARVRIGIASGIVVVGEIIGEAEARERDVVGQTPNIAARLQSVAEPDQIILADSTQQLVREVFHTIEIALPELKGMSDGLRAFLVDGDLAIEDRLTASNIARMSPIVGRKAEMDQLRQSWSLVEGGGTGAVLLSGEPGIGKSRIVQAFYDYVRNNGHSRVLLNCTPHHSQTAFYPIIRQLEKAAGIAPNDPDGIAFKKLNALLPDLLKKSSENGRIFANLLGRGFDAHLGPLELAPRQMRARTISVLTDYLLTRPHDAPSLVIVEDIHWIDQSTVEVLSACLTALASRKTLFVIAGRPDGTPSVLSEAIKDKIHLQRLNNVAARAIVAGLTQGKSLPEELVDEIFNKTDGVPLFVQELTKMIIESDEIEETETEFRMTGPMSALSIPSSLQDSLMARLDRLQHVKRTAQIAACIGRTFDLKILSEVASREPEEVRAALDELIEAELVIRPDEASSRYKFCHALVCDAAYESLLKSQRRTYHGQVAEQMENVAASPETLAYHYEAAGQLIPAAERLLQAGRNALRVSAAVEAISRFQRGRDLLHEVTSTSETKLLEMRLLGMLGTGYMLTKSWGAKEVNLAYSEALELVDETDDLAERIWVIWGAWVYQQVDGQIASSQNEARRAMEIASEGDQDGALLVAHVMLLQAAFYEGRWKTTLEHGAEIERLYDAERHGSLRDSYSLDLLLVWYVHGSQALWMLGDFKQADALRAKAHELSISIDHTYSRVWVAVWGANLDLLNGEVENILDKVPAAIYLSEIHGFDYVARLGHLLLAAAQLASGSELESFEGLDGAIEHFQLTGAGITIPYFLALKAQAQLLANRAKHARAVCEQAIAIIENKGERWMEPLVYRIKGDILASAEIGDLEGAKKAYQRASEIAGTNHAIVWQVQADLGLGRALIKPGDRAQLQNVQEKLDTSRIELERSSQSGHGRVPTQLISDLRSLGQLV